ncbi:BamA/TamA family outer membrane protein [Chitinophaga sp. Cy-1792]|uniref:BamA/TamA family outer membrane protein n=1 Tax=Chitinophaga sp. Cy-1792 TaxID=2608339 RepID=UPI0014235ADA|nr:BamA/TamA family outer membrane protein [Chitinophaga sp. Cy-1792]
MFLTPLQLYAGGPVRDTLPPLTKDSTVTQGITPDTALIAAADTTIKGIFNKIVYYLKHTNDVRPRKKFDFSIIGGPYYAPETSAGIAAMFAGLYSTDRADTALPLSSISVYGTGSLSGFYGIGINSITIFPNERFRLQVKASFSSQPNKYWGIGYDQASDKDNYTKYTLVTKKISADFSACVKGRLFAGVSVIVNDGRAQQIDTSGGKPLMQPDHVFGLGVGPFLTFDSRDFIPNAYKGIYARLGYKFFPSFLGNTATFQGWNAQFDWYKRVWKNCILATDLLAESNTSNVPWTLMPEAGGSNRLRGYFEGRFRDDKFLTGQVELRQKIYGRNGAVVWFGAGNVFPEFSALSFNQTLISYGIGYRWEFKRRINIRLDYGMGKDQSGFYFGINEVF